MHICTLQIHHKPHTWPGNWPSIIHMSTLYTVKDVDKVSLFKFMLLFSLSCSTARRLGYLWITIECIWLNTTESLAVQQRCTTSPGHSRTFFNRLVPSVVICSERYSYWGEEVVLKTIRWVLASQWHNHWVSIVSTYQTSISCRYSQLNTPTRR